ncbi:YjcZ family sporulation protein [Chengkuizengella axinellae]|uniref:YjcZ family sporulation protein n=1 Tax=Chengkuizengella axinellae TaxID=3064388 RepID=A0ABT9J2C3_9BACL|nr:YjcZ family sporulation protein [Chengkuizengella sp. 2205SS18-9]MDP5275718.1 YjcZ family sporulation protein [Chengkuizengella sp. 2205SS18-9]
MSSYGCGSRGSSSVGIVLVLFILLVIILIAGVHV